MNKPGQREFIAMMALIMSLIALSIDTILPALGMIASELKADHPNDAQLVISAVFLGMAIGLMLYGPLADSLGRKKVLTMGILIFLTGSIISLQSPI